MRMKKKTKQTNKFTPEAEKEQNHPHEGDQKIVKNKKKFIPGKRQKKKKKKKNPY